MTFTLRRLAALAVLVLGLSASTFAQSLPVGSGSITVAPTDSNCTTISSCVSVPLSNAVIESVTLQISGTFSQTLVFEATSDNVNWFAITGVNLADGSTASGASGTGQFSFLNSGLLAVRVRCSAYTSGTAVVAAVRGYASARWLIPFYTALRVGNGTAGAPAYSFASQSNKGMYSNATDQIAFAVGGVARMTITGTGPVIPFDTGQILFGSSADMALTRTAAGKLSLTGTTPMIQLGGTSSSFPALKQNSSQILVRLADDSGYAALVANSLGINTQLNVGGSQVMLIAGGAPTISSGFGTSPSIANNNGPSSFSVNVGTGGTATNGVIGLPTATTAWNCYATDITAASGHTGLRTIQTASATNSATIESQNSSGVATAWATGSLVSVACFAR